jgi:TolB-like protein
MSFIAELKRRNVIRVGLAYVLMGWVLLQAADFALDLIDAPNWIIQVFFLAVVIGLPVALFFAWAFEVTPEGVKRESEIDRSQSVTPKTGRKLDRAIIAFLVIALGLVLAERFLIKDQSPSAATTQTTGGEAVARSIAVLPFVNMSADPDNEYFSDGVSEEILNVLAGVPELQVAARTSAFAFKGSQLGIAQIANQLGVSHVLEGSVRKSGGQVRITAQLIQANNGFHLWSETYDRELTNIFAIQDEIAANIAGVLEVELLGEKNSFTTAQDLSPGMYEKFLKARFLMRRRSDEAIREAIVLNREVLETAPDFPRGLVQLAESLQISPENDGSNKTIEEEVRTLTIRALQLDPELAVAHMMAGQVADNDGDKLGALRNLRKAIELDPNEPRAYHWLGIALANTGYLEDARVTLQKAVDLEPDHANANGYLGFVEGLLGNLDRALYHVNEQARLGNPIGHHQALFIHLLRRDYDAARQAATKVVLPDFNQERFNLLLAAAEEPAALDQYLAYIASHEASVYVTVREYFVLHRFAEAVALMLDAEGHQQIDFIWSDELAESRNTPGFQPLVEKANLIRVWDAFGPPPACRKLADSYDCSYDVNSTP